MVRTWLDTYPELLEYEEQLLRSAGMDVERDELAMRDRVARLIVHPRREGFPDKLIVTFPDSYPYFRFEIQAPGLRLGRHQNPLAHNLCLLGRRSHHWTDAPSHENTVAAFILERLPQVISAADPATPPEQRPPEDPQGEPVTAYFAYSPGAAIFIDGDWKIDHMYQSGVLDIGIFRLPKNGFQAAVLKVMADNGTVLAKADEAIRKACSRVIWKGRWLRTEPILRDRPDDVYEILKKKDPKSGSLSWNTYAKMRWQVYGLLVHEESGPESFADGWMFCCRSEQIRKQEVQSTVPRYKQRKKKSR
jgi:hypothetical protein